MKIFASNRHQRRHSQQWRPLLGAVCGCASLSLLYIHMSASLVTNNDLELDLALNVENYQVIHRQPRSMIHGREADLAPNEAMSINKKKLPKRANTPSLWPNPTIVVGLPKMGTKTIHDYFVCGNINRVSHYRCADNIKCGQVIYENSLENKPPLHGTGAYNIYTQLDITANTTEGLPCFYPQVELLEELHNHHPHSTLILNKRNVTAWVASVERWFGMQERLVQCNITGFGVGVGGTTEELKKFYESQVKRVRNFCKRYPTHRLVEVDIDSPTAGQVMQDAFGIDKTCWAHTNNAKEMPILNQS